MTPVLVLTDLPSLPAPWRRSCPYRARRPDRGHSRDRPAVPVGVLLRACAADARGPIRRPARVPHGADRPRLDRRGVAGARLLSGGQSTDRAALPSLRDADHPARARARHRLRARLPCWSRPLRCKARSSADALLRALRLAWYTTDLLLDTDDALAAVCATRCRGSTRVKRSAIRDSARVRAAYEADRLEARTPHPAASALGAHRELGRRRAPHRADAAVHRRGRPSPSSSRLSTVRGLRRRTDEPRAVARRLPPPELDELLAAYPAGLTSQEVARVLADTTAPVDRPAAEQVLTHLVATGRARRVALGDDALWTPPDLHPRPNQGGTMDLSTSIPVVTGAGRGLGRHLVDALLERGATKVYGLARDTSEVRQRSACRRPCALTCATADSIAAARNGLQRRDAADQQRLDRGVRRPARGRPRRGPRGDRRQLRGDLRDDPRVRPSARGQRRRSRSSTCSRC